MLKQKEIILHHHHLHLHYHLNPIPNPRKSPSPKVVKNLLVQGNHLLRSRELSNSSPPKAHLLIQKKKQSRNRTLTILNYNSSNQYSNSRSNNNRSRSNKNRSSKERCPLMELISLTYKAAIEIKIKAKV